MHIYSMHLYATCNIYLYYRFTAINSSSHEKICTLCDVKTGDTPRKFSWTACMNRLRQFHFRHGKLTEVSAKLFPLKMGKLTVVDLSHNAIRTVEHGAFQHLIKLKVLKLSHNALESIVNITSSMLKKLEELDVR